MSLPEKAFPVSWDQFHRDARALAWRLADKGPGGEPFQAIVCITRGGLVPAAIESLAIVFGLFAPWRRPVALVVLAGAAVAGVFALRSPAYTDDMPAVISLRNRFAGGIESIDVRAPVAGTLSRAALGEINMPVEIEIEEEPAAAGARMIVVRVKRREGIPPIDRTEITYVAECAARWRGIEGPVETAALEPFRAEYFSAPDSFVERRGVEEAHCPISVSVRVQLAAPPVPV